MSDTDGYVQLDNHYSSHDGDGKRRRRHHNRRSSYENGRQHHGHHRTSRHTDISDMGSGGVGGMSWHNQQSVPLKSHHSNPTDNRQTSTEDTYGAPFVDGYVGDVHIDTLPDYLRPSSAVSTAWGGRRVRSDSLDGSVVTVDTSRAKSNLEAVRKAVKKLGWKEYPESRKDGKPCDIYWHNICYSDVKDTVPNGSRVNKFPGMNELAKKISLTRAIQAMQRLFPEEYDFYPRSWFIPAQLPDFYQEYYRNQRTDSEASGDGGTPVTRWYIVKPDEGAQGCGIHLVNHPDQIQNPDQQQLVQDYVDKPYLMQDNLKFDFRVYVVIKSLNPLAIYVSREGMARFCTQRYRTPSISNQDKAYMHLTNYSLNKTNEDYVHSSTIDEQGSKRLLSTVFHQLESKGVETRRVWHEIKLIVIKTVLAMVPELMLHYEHHFSQRAQGPACFHVMGFDVLLTHDLKPILLEVNASPSLTIGHDATSSSLEGILENDENKPIEKVYSVVDDVIKARLVRDTLLLVMDQLTAHTSKELWDSFNSGGSLDDSYPYKRRPCLREVFPARVGQLYIQLLFLDKVAYIYMQVINFKRTLNITIHGFRSFVKRCYLMDVMSSSDTDTFYHRLQKNFPGSDGVPFHGFVEFVMHVAKKKYPQKGRVEALNSLILYCQTQMKRHGVRSARLRREEVETEGRQQNKDGTPQNDIYLLPFRMGARPAGVKSQQPQVQSQSARVPKQPASQRSSQPLQQTARHRYHQHQQHKYRSPQRQTAGTTNGAKVAVIEQNHHASQPHQQHHHSSGQISYANPAPVSLDSRKVETDRAQQHKRDHSAPLFRHNKPPGAVQQTFNQAYLPVHLSGMGEYMPASRIPRLLSSNNLSYGAKPHSAKSVASVSSCVSLPKI